MIKAITVTNPKGESLRMELANPELSGIIVANVEGLGPAKANIVTNELATVDGSIFSQAKQSNRNIVLSLVMWPGEDVEQMRKKTYRYFPIKKPITLRVETDYKIVECTGYVESNEPVIFSSQEYTQISIVCPDPCFYDLEERVVSFSGTIALFEFPFSNESLTKNLLIFGEHSPDSRRVIDYEGDEDTGVTINIQVLPGGTKDIIIHNTDSYERFTIYADKIRSIVGSDLQRGDEIYISTIKGSKSVRLLREGTWINIISAIDKNSDWFQLSVGPNSFNFVGDNVVLTFIYRNAYGGV